jgi:acetoacetyl-CoA synthetase
VEIAVKKIIQGEDVTNRDALANPESLEYFKNIPELSV